jgi:hypothetical protein
MHSEIDHNNIWRVKRDVYVNKIFSSIIIMDDSIGIENDAEMEFAFRGRIIELGGGMYEAMPLPPNFPTVIMHFPSSGFAPDYFTFSSFKFCSARLRDALAQAPDVIEYTPIDFRCRGAKALAQDYQLMRIIAVQPAMDMQRSLYEVEDWGDPISSETNCWVREIDKLVLREDFVPRTEIFCMAERTLDVLATDALAERALKAGCIGLEFRHLETPDDTIGRSVTIRTKRGVSPRKERGLPRAED